jgi:hypothetical protein
MYYQRSYRGILVMDIISVTKDFSLSDSECGELVILRALNKNMNDRQFAEYCLKLGGFQIFQLVTYFDESNDDWVKV